MQLGLLPILGIIFVVLKLCSVITWSWWWVLSPFIVSFVIVVILLLAVYIFTPSRMR